MWKTVMIEESEPLALQFLKRKLLDVNCKCRGCQKYRVSMNLDDEEKILQEDYNNPVVIETQTEEVQAGSGFITEQRSDHSSTSRECLQQYWSNLFQREIMCPNCINTLNLYRSGITRVVKDEEIATRSASFTCDKSIGQNVQHLEKTTSLTCKPVLKYYNSIFGEVISQESSSESITSNRNYRREVKFAFNNNYYSDDDINIITDQLLNFASDMDQVPKLPHELDLAKDPVIRYLHLGSLARRKR